MQSRRALLALVAAGLAMAGPGTALPALADHTDPNSVTPVQETPAGAPVLAMPVLAWEHIAHFLANPGTDLKFFKRDGVTYAATGTLGGGPQGHAGQRFIKLVDADGTVAPSFVGDHGSAACGGPNQGTGSTSLQHDPTATPRDQAEIVIDATDGRFRCHDPAAAGLELIDVTGIGGVPDNDSLREVHLTRHDGYSHTNTVDVNRPWIVYNSNTDGGRPWIDVLDIRTCLGNEDLQLEAKREKCRPKVYRIPFKPEWTGRGITDGEVPDETAGNGCHDITSRGTRLYCAGISGTAIFDVTNLTDAAGNVRGTPLPCEVIDGTLTTAKVTNCDLGEGIDAADVDREVYEEIGRPAAEGWQFLGSYNHGPSSTSPREAVAISHEADPTPDHGWMFVTDERGGGISPPGAACATNVDNPQGNGGIHVFDIHNPAKPVYATDAAGNRAIFISKNLTLSPTFCTVHVIEQIPDEQRLVLAWYNQGIKIVDYDIAEDGTWSFEEVAYYNTLGNANWAAEAFRVVDNEDGTRTYFIMTSDVTRGVDVVKLTLEPNPITDHATTTNPPPPGNEPAPQPTGGQPTAKPRPRPRPGGTSLPATGADYGFLGAAFGGIAGAVALRRRRVRATR
jgi:hypothetical protein